MARSAEQFALGQLIPGTKYRTRAMIGSGGMGSVYEVEHIELGKLFVLKALRAGLVERTDLAARMKNEWRALGRLQHPNIVVVTDAGSTDDGVPFFVMERLEGETLASRMRSEVRLSVPLSLRISVGLLDALAAAHAIAVVHRDIKPQNIFLPAAGGVKLLDFGIAKLQDRDREAHVVTVRGVAIGTPRYMSPEQAEGKTVDGRADIYSLALVLFEMIAGKGPFAHRRDPNELVLAHMSEVPARLDVEGGAPSEIADLVHRWLSKSPADRPADASSAAAELRAILSRYTFDARASADASEEPTAHANYEASTQAGQAPAKLSESPRGRTLSLGTAPLAQEDQATRAEGAARANRGNVPVLPSVLRVSDVPNVAAMRPHAQEERGDTLALTGTMTPLDAPTTRTVLPALRVEPPAAAAKRRSQQRRRPDDETPPRSETAPPVASPSPPVERMWPRMAAVAAAAGAVSFFTSVWLSSPKSVPKTSASARQEISVEMRPARPQPSARASFVAPPSSTTAPEEALQVRSPAEGAPVAAASPKAAAPRTQAAAIPSAGTAAPIAPALSPARSAAAPKPKIKPAASKELPQSGL